MTDTRSDRPIVVGVDGLESSTGALAWATRHAYLGHASVIAVISRHYPARFAWAAPPMGEDFHVAGQAHIRLAQTFSDVIGDNPPVAVAARAVRGNPAPVLVEASRVARLPAVGNRGHGGFSDALLGLVCRHCTDHAARPVIVIRDVRATADAQPRGPSGRHRVPAPLNLRIPVSGEAP